MSNPKDGGPAFPVITPGFAVEGGHIVYPQLESWGMSLRDWFAGKALSGILGNHEIDFNPKDAAEWAYKHADAMIVERERRPEISTTPKDP